MKVIFIQNVAKQGQLGEIKEVATGFATNVLIPKGQAVLATKQAIAKLEKAKQNKKTKEEVSKNLFLKVVKDLENILEKESGGYLELRVKSKDKSGALFAQIKETEILALISQKLPISLNKEQIILPKEAIKKVGEYEIFLRAESEQKPFKLKIL